MIDTRWIKELTPRDALRIVWKKKWLLVLPMILVTLAAWGGSQLLTPVYRSSVMIAIGNPVIMSRELQRLTGFSGDYIGGDIDRGRERQALQNEIKSTQFLSKLIFRMNLDDDPELEKRTAELVERHPDWTPQAVKMDILTNRLKNSIQLDFVASNQIKISVYSSDPKEAKNLAENIGNIFMSEKKEQMMRMVYSSIDFSYEQLDKYNQALKEKIDEKNRLEEEVLKLQVEGSYGSDALRKQLNDEIQQARTEIENLEEDETRSKIELSQLYPSNLELENDSLIVRKKAQLKDLYASMAERLKTTHWKDPSIINLKEKVYNIEQEIENEINRLVENQFPEVTPEQHTYLKLLFTSLEKMEVQYSKLNDLRLAMAELDRNITLIPEYQSQLDQIDREISAARDLRDQFKVQQEGFQISQNLLNQSRIELIEPAQIPLKPVKPDKNKLILMGLILGFALGISAILLVELFDNSVKQISWVEKDLGVKVIGTIPKIK